jgi:hypothetical protein
MPILTPEQLNKLSEISNPLVRRRFTVFYQLPQDLQESMLAENTANSIWNLIKEKYHLQETSVSATAKIIGLIFLGELAIKDFITALKNDLNIELETAKTIAQDINLAIFQPVRESLMAVHNIPQTNADYTRTNADNQHDASNINQAPSSNFQVPSNTAPPNPTHYNLQPKLPADFETQRQKEELITKLKNQNNGNIKNGTSYQAKPASYNIPVKNIVDLRKMKRKSRNNGFFS